MPVISAAVVSKAGKILLARQFMEVTRIRVEGLLTAFPKLATSASAQSTYIDSGSIRYVYQPLEDLFLVLVTTRNSNIVDDLATLRLMGRLVSECVGPVIDDAIIQERSFEIIFALDEVVTAGQREAVSMEQVVTILEMQSNEEERAKAEKQASIDSAKKAAKAKAHELKQKRFETGFSGGGGGGSSSFSGGGGSGMYDEPQEGSRRVESAVVQEATTAAPVRSVGGMALSKAGRKTDQASRALAEAGLPVVKASSGAPAAPAATAASGASAAGSPSANDFPVALKIEEKISATLNRDGGVSSVDIRGDLFILIQDASLAAVRIRLAPTNDEFSFKSHPNINKNLFVSDSVLISKDKPFPVGQSLGILRWRAQALTKTKVPLSVNCWPSDDSASVEFELENQLVTLTNVTISMPLDGAFPTVDEIDAGSYSHSDGQLHWHIPVVDRANRSGTMSVQLNKSAARAFFPATVRFSMGQSLGSVQVIEVADTASGRPTPYGIDYDVSADDYRVQ